MMKKLIPALVCCTIFTNSIHCTNPLKQVAALAITKFFQKNDTQIHRFTDAFSELPLDLQQETERIFYLSNKQKHPNETLDNRLGLISHNKFPGVSYEDLIEIADYEPSLTVSFDETKLDLSGQYLTSIKGLPQITRFNSINIIDLSDNKLSTIPDYVLPALQHLRELNLSGNKFDKTEKKRISDKLTNVENIIF